MFKIFGCVGSSLLHRFLSSCSEQDLLFSYDVQSSHCAGFSCCGTTGSRHLDSVVVTCRL